MSGAKVSEASIRGRCHRSNDRSWRSSVTSGGNPKVKTIDHGERTSRFGVAADPVSRARNVNRVSLRRASKSSSYCCIACTSRVDVAAGQHTVSHTPRGEGTISRYEGASVSWVSRVNSACQLTCSMYPRV